MTDETVVARCRLVCAVLLAILVLAGCDATQIPQSAEPTATERAGDNNGADGDDGDSDRGDFRAVRLRGSGNDVSRFKIPRGKPAIAQITHRGSANFAVWAVGRSGREQDLLVNTIGNYEGTVLFDEQPGQHSVAFEVEADGQWSITVLPISRARTWAGRSALTGRGDDVVVLDPPSEGLKSTNISHKGSANFAVFAYGETIELLVNEIGRYRGESLLPPATLVLEVTADGSWRFTALE